jgi:predicted DNA-binding transcriptional regulator YafY
MARIVLELAAHPFGWNLDAIQRKLDISERTLARYIAACREELVDHAGRPIIEVVDYGERRALRFAESVSKADSNAWQAAALFFSLTLLRFLEGTILKEGVESLWDRLYRGLTPTQLARLRDLHRKFYAVPYAPKDYKAFDEQLDIIFRALVDQKRVRIDYTALASEPKTHLFDPYTLVAYRGGLYLLGKSDLSDTMIYLAVERIKAITFATDEGGEQLAFSLPAGYDPAIYTEGIFGIVSGEKTTVELLILNEETETYLKSRLIHPTQSFHRRRDGKTVLSMTVRGTTELRNWILSLGPWVKVLKPTDLREEVSGLLAQAARLYRR